MESGAFNLRREEAKGLPLAASGESFLFRQTNGGERTSQAFF
jgi:hypothetical protein